MTSVLQYSLIAGISALLLAVLTTPLVRLFSTNLSAIERRAPTRLGGLAIAVSVIVPLAIVMTASGVWSRMGALGGVSLVGLTFGLVGILALGLYDDVRGARPLEKLLIQVVIAVAMWSIGFRIEKLTNPLGGQLLLDTWTSMPLTVLWIVGITNAFNLIDGLDGLATGVALIAAITLFTFGWMDGQPFLCVFTAILVGALSGFLLYNFNPASIRMGDCGSLFLGFSLAIVSIISTSKQATAWALALPVIALGLPIFDTFMAIARRLRRGRPVMRRDTEHIHHQLLKSGYTHKQTVFILYGVSVALAAVAWTLKATHDLTRAMLIAGAAIVVFAIIHILGLRRRFKEDGTVADCLHPAALKQRTVLRRHIRTIRATRQPSQLWERVERALTVAGARTATLELFTRPIWRAETMLDGPHAHGEQIVPVSVPLVGETHHFGVLCVNIATQPGTEAERESAVLVHLIAEAVIDALEGGMAANLRPELTVKRMPGQ